MATTENGPDTIVSTFFSSEGPLLVKYWDILIPAVMEEPEDHIFGEDDLSHALADADEARYKQILTEFNQAPIVLHVEELLAKKTSVKDIRSSVETNFDLKKFKGLDLDVFIKKVVSDVVARRAAEEAERVREEKLLREQEKAEQEAEEAERKARTEAALKAKEKRAEEAQRKARAEAVFKAKEKAAKEKAAKESKQNASTNKPAKHAQKGVKQQGPAVAKTVANDERG